MMNKCKNIKNIKKKLSKNVLCNKKKQEIENSKKEQGDFDKNAVLTPPKT